MIVQQVFWAYVMNPTDLSSVANLVKTFFKIQDYID